jgi:hypothetical protein
VSVLIACLADRMPMRGFEYADGLEDHHVNNTL